MPANPPVMQAIIQDGYGTPERVLQLAETEVPSIGADDVLVRVRATSVNAPDWATVAGVPYIGRLGSGLRRPRSPVQRASCACGTACSAVKRTPSWPACATTSKSPNSPRWNGRTGARSGRKCVPWRSRPGLVSPTVR